MQLCMHTTYMLHTYTRVCLIYVRAVQQARQHTNVIPLRPTSAWQQFTDRTLHTKAERGTDRSQTQATGTADRQSDRHRDMKERKGNRSLNIEIYYIQLSTINSAAAALQCLFNDFITGPVDISDQKKHINIYTTRRWDADQTHLKLQLS